MEMIFDELTGYLWQQGIHIAVLFGVIAIACWLLRKKTAHWRYLLWLVIIAKCLVPSLMTVSVAIMPQKSEALKPAMTTAVPIIIDMPADAAPKYVVSIEKPMTVTNGSSLIAWLGELSSREWLGIIWLGGMALFTVIVSVKAVRFHHKLKHLRKPASNDLYSELCEVAGKGTTPRAWVLKGVGQPFVWGLLKGSIYLPDKFTKSTDSNHRRKILAHELAHVTRYDAFVNLLQTLAQGIFWFHPLVWIANRQIRAEREKCCDETAIAKLSASPRDYSNAIVNTLITEYKSTLPTPSLAIAGPIKNIEDRIKTIMKPGKKFYKSPTLVAIAVVLLLAVAVVPTTIALTEKQTEQVSIRQMDKSEVMELVEDFFKNNWKDVTARKSLAWGEPVIDKDGNVSIIYQFESTILGKDKKVSEKIFIFDRKGDFVSAKDIKQVVIEMMVFSVEVGSSFLESHFGVESVGKFLILNEEQKQKLKDPKLSPPMKRCIAAPKVLLMDGETAKVSTGENLDYADAEAGASKLDVKMTPHVVRKGAVLLELDISMKTLDGRDDSDKQIISARQIVTSFSVGEGKTTLLELAGKGGSKGSQGDGERIFAIVTPVVVGPPAEGERNAVAAANRMSGLRRTATPPSGDIDQKPAVTRTFSNVVMTKEADSQTPEGQVLIDMQLITVESKDAFLKYRLGVENAGSTLVLSKDQKKRLEDISLSPEGIQWIARPKLLVNKRSSAMLKTTHTITNQNVEAQDGNTRYDPEYDIVIKAFDSSKGMIRLELDISLKAQTGEDGSGNAMITARKITSTVAVENGKTTLFELAGQKDSDKAMFVIITPTVLEHSITEDEMVERVLSGSKMKRMATAWYLYVDQNNGRLAGSPEDLAPYLKVDVFTWVKENVVFIAIAGKHSEITAPQNRPIAFDRMLLRKGGGTNVAFADGHFEYCDIDRLDKLGIAADVVKKDKAMDKLLRAGNMLYVYAHDNDDKLPASLDELEPYDENDLLGWMKDNVEYISGKVEIGKIREAGRYAIAYNKKLLSEMGGTTFLFADCHTEFLAIGDFDKILPANLVDIIKQTAKAKKAVAIGSRFIKVDEDYLEAVGLDREFAGGDVTFLPKKETELKIEATLSSGPIDKPTSSNVGVEAAFVDDSQVELLIKATQKHSGSSMLTAPKVTVMDGEGAQLMVHTERVFIAGYKEDHSLTTAGEPVAINDTLTTGITLLITPRLTDDGKHCVLELESVFSDLNGYDRRRYRKKYSYEIPRLEVLKIKCTGFYIPAGKTLLLVAPRGNSDDKKVMLILVNPEISKNHKKVPSGLQPKGNMIPFGGGMLNIDAFNGSSIPPNSDN